MTSLVCNSNQLPKLDVSKNINLISLVCNSNQLTGLDVSKNINLTSLACNSNQLTGLNVSKNVNLKNLDCSINQLTTLDVSKNVNLISLYSNSNSLLSLNLKNGNNISFNKTLLDFKGNPNLSCIEVEDATYSNTNWSNLKDTTASYNLYCSPYTLIPDDNFERALIALGLDTGAIDGKVLRSNIASVTSLNVGSKTIYDLTGIQDFTALTSLSCYGNKLTALDLSKNVNLTYLACYGNNLATLDVSKNVKLSQLDCFTNQLTVINVSNNVKLLYFYCQENKLSNLNVTKNINLLHLSCYSNQLTTLDVSNNVKLLNFYCQSNKLTNLDVSRNVMLTRLSCNDNSLLNLNLKNGNNIALSKTLSDFRNNPNLSCIQVDDVTYSNLNWETNKDATATYNTNCNPYTFIPDVNFENKLISLGIDSGVSDGKVLTSSISSLTSLNVTNSSITDLTGVQDFVALTTLNCSTNKLISLDVSKNLALTKLYCSGNQLTNLDLSENLALNNLTCASNQLTSLNLKNNIALTFLNCATNKLTNLDVTNNTLLTTFFCHYNQLTTIDLSKNILLGYFVCYKNNLTTIDVSKNSDLYMFDLFDNQITSLDVSKNPKLTELACENNQLTYLNLKNGANTILDLTYSNFVNNPNLTCILVDDAIYSNTNWVNIKDATAGYSENCGATIVLPSDNFAVESKGETCVNENNGEISITAKETHTYVAIINGKSYPFVNNSLKVASLTPSTYTVSITITGEIFEQIFTIVIAKGATITGKSSIVNNKVAVEIIEGTAPYTVFVDGVEQFETSDSSFSIETKKGSLLQVKTAKACEGIYAKDIVGLNESVTAYPNPTSGSFEIELPTSRKEVAIKLYTLDGHLISNKTYTIENGKAQLSLENQPTGVYVAKIELDTPDYLKIIKN